MHLIATMDWQRSACQSLRAIRRMRRIRFRSQCLVGKVVMPHASCLIPGSLGHSHCIIYASKARSYHKEFPFLSVLMR